MGSGENHFHTGGTGMKFILHTDRPENLGLMARAAATCAMSVTERRAIDRHRRQRERDRQTSSDFNRAMIDLYNARRP